MKILDKHNIVCFDVDGTLIKPFHDCTEEEKAKLPSVTIDTPWGYLAVKELAHITAKVRQHHIQGHYVIVWSQGGHEWAEFVVKALDLEDQVDMIMTKPKWAYDDIPLEDWCTRTIP